MKQKKKQTLEQAIKIRKKQLLTQTGAAPTKEDLEQIIREETDTAYNKTVQTMLAKLDQLDEMSGFMSKAREMLLRKFINFDSMYQYDSEELKKKIYDLLFDWREFHAKGKDLPQDAKDDASQDRPDVKDEAQSAAVDGDSDVDKEEKKKRQQLRLDQELFEFEERGGFAQVLKDIFNPSDPSSMELDSVFQLKQLVRTYYEKKELLSTQLVQSLDAMANERPWVLRSKKKHFEASNSNLGTSIEFMRINAERDRIKRF